MYTVADVMTTRLITAQPGDSLASAAKSLEVGRIRHLPVLQGERLVGVLTQRDLLRRLSNLAPEAAERMRVGEAMTREVKTVRRTASLRRAARWMLEQKLGCLPVVGAGERLEGIVTEADLVRFGERMAAELEEASATLRRLEGR